MSNPVSALNEYCQKNQVPFLEFKFDKQGKDHDPFFVAKGNNLLWLVS